MTESSPEQNLIAHFKTKKLNYLMFKAVDKSSVQLRTVSAAEIRDYTNKQESISVPHRRLGSSSWCCTERSMQVL